MDGLAPYLEHLIVEKGTNKYQISKNSSLDRTTLQRLLKGERLPGVDFIEKLCDYLSVTPLQRDKVRELYQIQKIGKGTYENRLYIKNILENITDISAIKPSSVTTRRSISLHYLQDKETIVIDKKFDVQAALRDIIEDELLNNQKPDIKLTAPFSFEYLFSILKSYCVSLDKDIVIEHVIKLSKNQREFIDKNYNLKILTNILSFAFNKSTSYVPHYYYGNVEYSSHREIPMPYYILTSNYLLQLSDKLDKLVITNNKDMYRLYQNAFEEQKTYCHKLIMPLENAFTHLLIHTQNCQYRKRKFSLQPQPAFGVYYNSEMLEKKIKNDLPNREHFIELANSFFSSVIDAKPTLKNYFTKEGLDMFAENGTLVDIPQGCTYDLTLDDKLYFLRKLYDDIMSDAFYSRVIDATKFDMSQSVSFAFYESMQFILFYRDEKDNIDACYIDESEIANAFDDYFTSLEDSEYIFSKEDTLAIIDSAIKRIEVK